MEYNEDEFNKIIQNAESKTKALCIKLTGAYVVWSSTLENTVRIYCN